MSFKKKNEVQKILKMEFYGRLNKRIDNPSTRYQKNSNMPKLMN